MKVHKKNLLNLIDKLHKSDKSFLKKEKNNIYVFKVHKKAKKREIKFIFNNFFKVEIEKINTLIMKGKIKRNKNYLYKSKNWKKAYVSIKKGYELKLT